MTGGYKKRGCGDHELGTGGCRGSSVSYANDVHVTAILQCWITQTHTIGPTNGGEGVTFF